MRPATSSRSVASTVGMEPQTARRMARTRSVLIVEDNADQAETLKVFLSLKGHRLEVAASGPAAI